jgi:hypothetical protein
LTASEALRIIVINSIVASRKTVSSPPIDDSKIPIARFLPVGDRPSSKQIPRDEKPPPHHVNLGWWEKITIGLLK